MILDKIDNWKLYTGLGEGIARGLELLSSGRLDALIPGRHDLDGDKLYASVQEYQPKPAGEGRWEAHRKYMDIQYLVSGCEVMGYCAAEKLQVAEAYDAQKDVAFFAEKLEAGTAVKVSEKMFAIFYPQDAHMPMLAPDALTHAGQELGWVKKIVLKVLLFSAFY